METKPLHKLNKERWAREGQLIRTAALMRSLANDKSLLSATISDLCNTADALDGEQRRIRKAYVYERTKILEERKRLKASFDFYKEVEGEH